MRYPFLIAGAIVAVSAAAFFRYLPSHATDGPIQKRFTNSTQDARWGKEYLPNLPVVDVTSSSVIIVGVMTLGPHVRPCQSAKAHSACLSMAALLNNSGSNAEFAKIKLGFGS